MLAADPTAVPSPKPTISIDLNDIMPTPTPTHKPSRDPTLSPTVTGYTYTPSEKPTWSPTPTETEYPTGFSLTHPPTPTDFNGATMAPTPTEMFPIELRTNPPTPTLLFPPNLKTFAPSPSALYVPSTGYPSPQPSEEPTVQPDNDDEESKEDDDNDDDEEEGDDEAGGDDEDEDEGGNDEPTVFPTSYPTDNSTVADDDTPIVLHIAGYSHVWNNTDTIITTVIASFAFLCIIVYLFCCVYVAPSKLIERDGLLEDPYIKNRHYTLVATVGPDGRPIPSAKAALSSSSSSSSSSGEKTPLLDSRTKESNRRLLRTLRTGEGAAGGGGGVSELDEEGSDIEKMSDFNI